MAEAILDIRLDTVQPNRVRLVYGVQNDYNSRYLCVRFLVNGEPINIEKTASASINAKRPDGEKDAFPGTVNADGTVKVPVAQWMLGVPGEVTASVAAVTSTGRLTTQEFYIMAKSSVWDGTDEPSADNPDKDLIQTIIASENERVAAEAQRVANENARKTAETARATAETQRISDEAARVQNEAGRVSAEEVRREEFATWAEEWGKISSFDKRLENLEAAVSPGLVTPMVDSEVAYSKTVPTGALPNAAVTEVGGMSYKCENLFQLTINTTTQGGVTLTPNGDGSFTVNGTATSNIYFNLGTANLETGTYTLCGGFKGGSWTKYALYAEGQAQWYSLGGASTYTVNSGKQLFQLAVYKGTTVSNLTVFPMVNKGETALPFQPYFTGLRDSKVTEIESVGANLLPFPYVDSTKTANGVTWTLNADRSITATGTATAYSQFALADGVPIPKGHITIQLNGKNVSNAALIFRIYDASKTVLLEKRIYSYETINVAAYSTAKTFSALLVRDNDKAVTGTFLPMINAGTEAKPYTPYFRKTLTMPADALEGYGQGVNKDYCNKIVLDPLEGVKKYVKAAKKVVFDGSADEGWEQSTKGTNFSQFYCDGGILAPKALLCDTLPNITVGERETTAGIIPYEDAKIRVSLLNPQMTLAEFLAWLSQNPITVCASLATPTETDISPYFNDDNLLPVEAGGTITAVNEYEQAVPFSIEYTVKGA